jgi:hypothetical protein
MRYYKLKTITKIIPYFISYLSMGFLIYVLAKAIHHTLLK